MLPEKEATAYLTPGKRHDYDDTPKPKWGTAPDGRYTDISGDERFDQLFKDWQSDACDHERKGIVRWVNGGGQTIYNWFCGHCGTKLSPNVKAIVAEGRGAFEVTMDALASRHQSYMAERKARLEALTTAAAERAQPGNREEYGDYLRSPRWRDLRAKVLARAGGLCEGCLTTPAVQVHHLTYEHIGNEFAFELRALCDQCHHRLHEADRAVA